MPVDRALTGLVFDFDRFAIHDGPGIRTMVYLKGCPLRCLWCHSPESQGAGPELLFYENKCIRCGACVAACPNGAQFLGPEPDCARRIDREKCRNCGKCVAVCPPQALELCGETMTVGQVVDQIARDKIFFDTSGGGVTLTGGEVTMQARFAANILEGCRELGIHTAVETSGYTTWANLEMMVPHVSLWLYDVKMVDAAKHREFTGVDNALILENLAKLAATGADVQIRVPTIPRHNDTAENIQATVNLAARLGIRRIAFLPYNVSTGAKYAWIGAGYTLLPEEEPQPRERLDGYVALARAAGVEAQVGG